jgi:hypothetical protein
MLNLLAAGALAVSMLGSPIISVPDDPVPGEKITIDVITVNGSGCPVGSAAIAVSPDNTAFTVTYSNYMAQVGVGALPTDFRKNCQMALQVHVPTGFTYAIVQADYRGYGYLEPGATATQRANYYFQGMSGTSFNTHNFRGPLDDYWQTTDVTPVASLSFAPCGEQRYLNINTELRVNRGSSSANTTSFMAMDSADGSIDTKYHFAWRKCNA